MRYKKLNRTQITARSSREARASEIAKPAPHPVLQLQADIGNRATSGLIYEQSRQNTSSGLLTQIKPMFGGLSRELSGGHPIQAKLTLGAVGDKYEQEADRVAAEVTSRLNGQSSEVSPESQSRSGAAAPVQRKTAPSPIQAKEGGAISPELEGSIQQAKGSGSPLPKPLRSKMEQAFGGADFGGVKVHTGAEGDMLNRSIQARAFTTGRDIFFRQGEYNPTSHKGQGLLAHELTHVVQQQGVSGNTLMQRKGEPKEKWFVPVENQEDLEDQDRWYDALESLNEIDDEGFQSFRLLFETLDPKKLAVTLDKKKLAVTPDTWKGKDEPSDRQFENDVAIMYQTMFADPDAIKDKRKKGIKDKEKQRTLEKQKFMRRLHLAMAVGGVKMSKEDNPDTNTELPDLDIPLAAILSHGQRQLFETKAKSGKEDLQDRLFNYLLSGDPQSKPSIVKPRLFASHGTDIDSQENIKELKHGLIGQFMGAFTGEHKRVNIPLGGIGNLDVNKNIIGPGGKPIDPNTERYIRGKQHGHIYINKHKRGETGALMFGLEGAAPWKTNMFNVEHNAGSGTEDQTEKISATGGKKMSKLLGDSAPAEYGGKRTVVNEDNLSQMMAFEAEIAKLSEDKQKELYAKLLQAKPSEGIKILEEYVTILKPIARA
ncbi:MAG: DUF4157 domain-containing protein [Oscillatoria sp. SIO1A7]|nr:DUF4157 domain-containing protein [Oscillatoria sp. SIO1A7]